MSLRFFFELMLFAYICHPVEIKEYGIKAEVCVWENFKVNCSENEEINIRSAFYGLMGSERCLNENKSLIEYNCSVDVRFYFERLCNERRNCEIHLPDQQLDAFSANYCRNSLIQYLEIVYECHNRKSSCPEFKPPEFAKAENNSTGFRVLCIESDIDTWEVTCVQGNWTPQYLNRCRPRGENLVMVFGILSLGGIISVLLIVTVFIVMKCRIRHQAQHFMQSHDVEVLPSGKSLTQTVIYQNSESEELKSTPTATLKRNPEKETLGRKVITFEEENHIYSFIADAKDAEVTTLQNDESLLYATIDSL